MAEKIDCAVIGAGVVGLAVARALALRGREVLVLAPLIALIFIIGIFPGIILDRTKDSVQLAYNQFKAVSGQAIRFGDDRDAKLLGTDDFNPAFLQGAPDVTLKNSMFGNRFGGLSRATQVAREDRLVVHGRTDVRVRHARPQLAPPRASAP